MQNPPGLPQAETPERQGDEAGTSRQGDGAGTSWQGAQAGTSQQDEVTKETEARQQGDQAGAEQQEDPDDPDDQEVQIVAPSSPDVSIAPDNPGGLLPMDLVITPPLADSGATAAPVYASQVAHPRQQFPNMQLGTVPPPRVPAQSDDAQPAYLDPNSVQQRPLFALARRTTSSVSPAAGRPATTEKDRRGEKDAPLEGNKHASGGQPGDMAYEFSRSKKSSTHGAKKGAKDPPQKNDPAPPSTVYPTLDDIRGAGSRSRDSRNQSTARSHDRHGNQEAAHHRRVDSKSPGPRHSSQHRSRRSSPRPSRKPSSRSHSRTRDKEGQRNGKGHREEEATKDKNRKGQPAKGSREELGAMARVDRQRSGTGEGAGTSRQQQRQEEVIQVAPTTTRQDTRQVVRREQPKESAERPPQKKVKQPTNWHWDSSNEEASDSEQVVEDPVVDLVSQGSRGSEDETDAGAGSAQAASASDPLAMWVSVNPARTINPGSSFS